jgi:beta-glucosidase
VKTVEATGTPTVLVLLNGRPLSIPWEAAHIPVAVPVKQLRGFERVELNPDETKTVTMKITPEDLKLLDRDMHWTVVPGTFDIMVGKSSADAALSVALPVKGANPLTGQGLSR